MQAKELRQKNPFIDLDIDVIISCFEQTNNAADTEQSVYAAMMPEVLHNKATSRASLKGLRANWLRPTNQIQNEDTEAQPLAQTSEDKITGSNTTQSKNLNSFVGISRQNNSDNQSEWFKDCIPCNLKHLSWDDLWPDFMDLLKAEIDKRLGFFGLLERLLNDTSILDELCQFLSLLNFQCIPDLQRMLFMLLGLLEKYAFRLNDLAAFLMEIIKSLLQPLVSGYTNIVKLYLDLIIRPINCVIDAINLQAEKLNLNPVAEATRSFLASDPLTSGLLDEEGQKEDQFPRLRIERLSSAELDKKLSNVASKNDKTNTLYKDLKEMETGLASLNFILEEGVEYFEAKGETLTNWLQDIIGLEEKNSFKKMAMLGKKLQIIRFIALIKALINFKTKCGNRHESKKRQGRVTPEVDIDFPFRQDEVDTFFVGFVNNLTLFGISLNDDGDLVIIPPEEVSDDNLQAPATDTANRPDTPPSVKVIKSCLFRTSASDLEKIRAFEAKLEQEGF